MEPMEPVEPMEPWKRRHRLRRGASFHTRQGPGLREFMNKLPQIKLAVSGGSNCRESLFSNVANTQARMNLRGGKPDKVQGHISNLAAAYLLRD